MMTYLKIGVVILRISLGFLFVYGGVQKFVTKERPKTETVQEIPDNVKKIRGFIGGLKKSEYFWAVLGVAEILTGVLLCSQYLALLGAVMLVPITLNIFLFHLFLTPDDLIENIQTGFYLLGNLVLIAWHYPDLKSTFLNFKLI